METILRFEEEDQRRKDALGRDENGKLFTWIKVVRSGFTREEELKINRDKKEKRKAA